MDRVMKIYELMVNLTPDEERATREKVVSYLAEKPELRRERPSHRRPTLSPERPGARRSVKSVAHGGHEAAAARR